MHPKNSVCIREFLKQIVYALCFLVPFRRVH